MSNGTAWEQEHVAHCESVMAVIWRLCKIAGKNSSLLSPCVGFNHVQRPADIDWSYLTDGPLQTVPERHIHAGICACPATM